MVDSGHQLIPYCQGQKLKRVIEHNDRGPGEVGIADILTAERDAVVFDEVVQRNLASINHRLRVVDANDLAIGWRRTG